MQHDKLRRGLAASAVGALAVTGLTVATSPAHAAEGDGARMVSQSTGTASLRVDIAWDIGERPPTVELVAERLDADATLRFEVNADPGAADDSPGWTPVGDSFAPPGRFVRHEWDGLIGAQSAAGSSVAIRVAATTGDGTTYSTVRDVAVEGLDGDHSVRFRTAELSYFTQPYADSSRTSTLAVVRGNTSATDGAVQLSWWHSGAGEFRGTTAAAVSPADLKYFDGTDSTTVPGGAFDAVLDITGYDAASPDGSLAIRAVRDSDGFLFADVPEAQVITSVSVPTAGPVGSKGMPVRIEVADQDLRSIPGAEVRRTSDGSLVGYTDGRGAVVVLQPTETTESYYVNATDVDAYEEGVDVVTADIVAPAYQPIPSGTRAVLADGDVFDDDEYREGDVAIQLLDQEGTPLRQAGVELGYALHRAGTQQPELTSATTDARGRVVVPFDPEGEDGRYRLVHTVPGADVPTEATATFVAGDARLRLTPAKGKTPSGGKIKYVGRLTIGKLPLPRPPHRPALPARHRDQARSQGRRRHQGRRQAQAHREGPHPQERHLHRRRHRQGRTRPARRERPAPRHRQDRQGAAHRPRHLHPETAQRLTRRTDPWG
ncbi:hypothetical protein [Nocardioides sp. TF02-7]|uniref:hypothetical protein n=1 Tax=Nocardioides sp. TF02-7 TaxID=2917724 RepID=UPI001F0567F4|nr:hypothetical protein [Nocardioides sp. TF02-7]UMG93757.1 hypothetical protein MF408_06255 [Nocardioides sp. TF02-7]